MLRNRLSVCRILSVRLSVRNVGVLQWYRLEYFALCRPQHNGSTPKGYLGIFPGIGVGYEKMDFGVQSCNISETEQVYYWGPIGSPIRAFDYCQNQNDLGWPWRLEESLWIWIRLFADNSVSKHMHYSAVTCFTFNLLLRNKWLQLIVHFNLTLVNPVVLRPWLFRTWSK